MFACVCISLYIYTCHKTCHYTIGTPFACILFIPSKISMLIYYIWNTLTCDSPRTSGIPALVLLDGQTGELISTNGRQIIQTDPTGEGFPWGLQWQLENEMGHITSGQTGLFACCAVLCLVPCSIVTQIVCLPCTLLNFCFGARQGGS
jgi:hypothetical protein